MREHTNARGGKAGETAGLGLEGIAAAQAAGAGVSRVDPVLVEIEAARAGIERARPGDLVVICADDAEGVYKASVAFDRGPRIAIDDPGASFVPRG